MIKRKTTEQFVQELIKIFGDSFDYNEVEYINSKTKVKIFCKKCKKFIYARPDTLLRGCGCGFCNGKGRTVQDILELFYKKHSNNFTYYPFRYKCEHDKIKIKCNKCGLDFYQSVKNHLRGCGCPFCANNVKFTQKIFIEKLEKIHGKNFFGYDKLEYTGNDKIVCLFCKKCQKYFYRTPHKLLSGFGCQHCSISTGEEKIIKLLTNYNVSFVYQKTFKNCRHKQPLRFDFYLPDYNLCIEFQGEQHYNPKMMISLCKSEEKGIESFKNQQIRDQIKRKYCKDNGIKLLEIKYNENIRKILEKTLKISSNKKPKEYEPNEKMRKDLI